MFSTAQFATFGAKALVQVHETAQLFFRTRESFCVEDILPVARNLLFHFDFRDLVQRVLHQVELATDQCFLIDICRTSDSISHMLSIPHSFALLHKQ